MPGKKNDRALHRVWHLIIIQRILPLSETTTQQKKIISCCLLCPCIMGKVRKLNTAHSKGCLWSTESCSSTDSPQITSWRYGHNELRAMWSQMTVRGFVLLTYVCSERMMITLHDNRQKDAWQITERAAEWLFVLHKWNPVIDFCWTFPLAIMRPFHEKVTNAFKRHWRGKAAVVSLAIKNIMCPCALHINGLRLQIRGRARTQQFYFFFPLSGERELGNRMKRGKI